jgi:hypothetical protein
MKDVTMMFTFVLVHGHWHGNTVWSALTPLLIEKGHRVVAPQLPSDRLGQGARANAQAVLEACEAAPGCGDASSVVLVGHSAAGLTIPLVARERPVLHMIFLAAVLPIPGVTLEQQFSADPGAEVDGFTWLIRSDGLLEMTEDVARRHFYSDLAKEDADEAVANLRLQTPTTLEEASPLDRWPAVTSDYLVCSQDRVLDPDWQRRLARDRLGVEPIEIESGHSAALSQPRLLADLLPELALRQLHPMS